MLCCSTNTCKVIQTWHAASITSGTAIEAEIIGIHENIIHDLFYTIWRDFVQRNMQENENISKSTK